MTVHPDRHATDRFDIDYHGGTFTHLDALCHVAYENKPYNGFDFQGFVTNGGCSKYIVASAIRLRPRLARTPRVFKGFSGKRLILRLVSTTFTVPTTLQAAKSEGRGTRAQHDHVGAHQRHAE